jgi:hypothetical protein
MNKFLDILGSRELFICVLGSRAHESEDMEQAPYPLFLQIEQNEPMQCQNELQVKNLLSYR